MNPQLLIIGGPNGAGKSTFSRDLSSEGALIYDTDLVIARLKAEHPLWPNESIIHAVQQDYLDAVDAALRRKQDFTLETNLRDSSILETVNRFKAAGYELGLIFMCLRSAKQSMDRVKRRVKSGGHYVDKQSIQYNFVEGLKSLEYLASRFDNVEVLDASQDVLYIKSMLSIQQKRLISHDINSPTWIRPTLQKIAEQLRADDLDNDISSDRPRGLRR